MLLGHGDSVQKLYLSIFWQWSILHKHCRVKKGIDEVNLEVETLVLCPWYQCLATLLRYCASSLQFLQEQHSAAQLAGSFAEEEISALAENRTGSQLLDAVLQWDNTHNKMPSYYVHLGWGRVGCLCKMR
jgi:hypothetical protein